MKKKLRFDLSVLIVNLLCKNHFERADKSAVILFRMDGRASPIAAVSSAYFKTSEKETIPVRLFMKIENKIGPNTEP